MRQAGRQLGDRMHYELMVLTNTLYTGETVVSRNECAVSKGRDQFRSPEHRPERERKKLCSVAK